MFCRPIIFSPLVVAALFVATLLTGLTASAQTQFDSHASASYPPLALQSIAPQRSLTQPVAQTPIDRFNPNDEPWVVRIYFSDQTTVNRLAAEIDVWSVEHADGYLVAMVGAAELAYLDKLNLDYEADPEQMAHLRELAEKRETVRSASSSPTDGIPEFPCYRTVEETYADLADLASTYPSLATWIDIGDSWDKVTADGPAGYDIHALVLTNEAVQMEKPKLFIVAAVHARELTTSELVARFGELLVNQYGVDPDITWLLDYNEIHLVPHGNPDGRKQAEELLLWRKNRNLVDGACLVTNPSATRHGGIDLNRNSSFLWNSCSLSDACSSSNPCAQTYRGVGPASEPETQALQGYMSSIFSDTRPVTVTLPADLDTAGIMLTLHSYSELIIFPWGWTTEPAPNDAELTTLGSKFGYFTQYDVCRAGAGNCLYLTDGTNDDWAYGELGVPSYTFELGTAFFQSCTYFEENILDKNMDALLYAAKAARLPYQLPAGPEVVSIDLGPSLIEASKIITTSLFTMTIVADDDRYASSASIGTEPTQVITAARYSIDVPSWITGTQLLPMTIRDGNPSSDSEALEAIVDTAGWKPGQYTIFAEAQDADGNWGVPTAANFTISRQEFEAELVSDATAVSTRLGQDVSYQLYLTNYGWSSDAYTLTVTSTWPISLPSSISIPAGRSAQIELVVSVPPTATQDLSALTFISDTITVVAQSLGAEQRIGVQNLIVAASPYRRYFPIVY